MTMTAVYIDIWQQCTLKGTGLKSLWVEDILGTKMSDSGPLKDSAQLKTYRIKSKQCPKKNHKKKFHCYLIHWFFTK